MMLEGCYLSIYRVRSARISWNPWGTGNCCKYLEAISSYNFYKWLQSSHSFSGDGNDDKKNEGNGWYSYEYSYCTFSSWKAMLYVLWCFFEQYCFFFMKVEVHRILSLFYVSCYTFIMFWTIWFVLFLTSDVTWVTSTKHRSEDLPVLTLCLFLLNLRNHCITARWNL